VYIALKELAKLGPQDERHAPRRRAIIVLSDGDDTSSLVTFEEVLDLASRSDTIIYAIGLTGREPTGLRNRQDGQFMLRRLAQQTGGPAFFPHDARDLAAVYRDIRDELASQYAIAYESGSTGRDGRWRTISVRVNRPSLRARTRQGYFAPSK
jgi:Ca-activated chloride channel family protein